MLLQAQGEQKTHRARKGFHRSGSPPLEKRYLTYQIRVLNGFRKDGKMDDRLQMMAGKVLQMDGQMDGCMNYMGKEAIE